MYLIDYFFSWSDLGYGYIGVFIGCLVGYMLYVLILRSVGD